jgi:hypothetical protein
MSPLVQELVMSAVRVARNSSITKVAVLRQRLAAMYPTVKASDIDSALHFWAAAERRTAVQAYRH